MVEFLAEAKVEMASLSKNYFNGVFWPVMAMLEWIQTNNCIAGLRLLKRNGGF
eukprot:gene14282-17360_t